jgi:hypothetical protein
MKLKDLYTALEQLGPQNSYYLNKHNRESTYILEYNKRKKLWEYYFLDERGGKSDFKTFATEKEACEEVLNAAIESIKTFRDAYMDAVKRKYLEADKFAP